jgi:hypothetical protein
MRLVRAPSARIVVAGFGGIGLVTAIAFALSGLPVVTRIGLSSVSASGAVGVIQLLVAVVPLYLLAVLLVRLRPDNPVTGYGLLFAGMWGVEIGIEPAATFVLERVGAGGWFWAANLAYQCAETASILGIVGALVLFPDGIVERRGTHG